MIKRLLNLQIKEEWRMMTAYFSSKALILFPIVLFGAGVFMGRLIPIMEQSFDMHQFYSMVHLLLILYGIFVGGFGFFAEAVVETWFGEARLLIQTYDILPISFTRLFSLFYLKDIIYYMVLTLLPIFSGLFFSFSISSSLFLTLLISLTLAFLLGISTSFFLSSLYVRNRWSVLPPLVLLGYWGTTGSYETLPPLAFFFQRDLFHALSSVILFFVFSAISLYISIPIERYRMHNFSPSTLFSRIDTLLAKEIVEVRRSGTWRILLTAYLFPLLFLYSIFHFSGKLLQIQFTLPLPFYAVFIGYLSTLVYSWLNNIDTPAHLHTLPITVSAVIKRKLALLAVVSFSVGTGYLLFLGYTLNDFTAVPISLFAMVAVTLYVALVTAYLCGLHPNTYLFNGVILMKYLATTLPVLITLTLLSLMNESVALVLLSGGIFLLAAPIYRGLEIKYGVSEGFQK